MGLAGRLLTNGGGGAPPPGAAFYDVVGHSLPGGGGVVNGDWNGYVDKLMFMLGAPRRKNGSSASAAIFTLPAGYRPANTLLYDVGASAVQQIQITAAGVVNAANGGSTAATILDGISFPAEQ